MAKKILVIDDDVLVLKTIKNVLSKNGFDVQIARDADSACRAVREEKIDLIVCDVRMPGEDGLSLMRKLKGIANERQLEIPFMFATGYASEDVPVQAMELGAVGYILKPLDMDQLLTTIGRALRIGNGVPEACLKRISELFRDFKQKKADLIKSDSDLSVLCKELERILSSGEIQK